MPIDWSLGHVPNFAQAALTGIDAGRKMRHDRDTQQALTLFAQDPDAGAAAALRFDVNLGTQLGKIAKERRVQALRGRVFGPSSTNPVLQGRSISGEANQLPTDDANDPPVIGPRPDPLVQPEPQQRMPDAMNLPPRTDGLTINRQALNELYAEDPDGAAAIEEAVYKGDKRFFENVQRRGEAMGVVASDLARIPEAERPAQFREWESYLRDRGFDAQALAQADLSDRGLERYSRGGRLLTQVLDDDRADRRLAADIADDEADNARADRNTASLIEKRSQPPAPPAPRAPRADSPNAVLAGIMRKVQSGAKLSPGEQQMYNDYRARRSGGGRRNPPAPSSATPAPAQVKVGTVIMDPNTKQRRRWSGTEWQTVK